MKFYVYEFDTYREVVELDSEDYETEFSADVSDCYDEEADDWNEEKIYASVEAQVKERFGEDTVIVWEGR